jgi:D-tagatose-1,6-bisphosphate aldolase subunit GatZ/KbaZ
VKPHSILETVRAQKAGEPAGAVSVCSANPFVLEAAMREAGGAAQGAGVLLEATSNQVNPSGGYSGMTPLDYAAFVREIASRLNFDSGKIMLGGDHLGPLPWRGEPSEKAMSNACSLVTACVEAGFGKLHLDASMACGDDPADRSLDARTVAGRSARLCQAAEAALRNAARKSFPYYVIGSDVPAAGGARGSGLDVHVTKVSSVEETLELTKQAFGKLGLEAAWERVIAVVVQPGVEFSDSGVMDYDPDKAADLSRFIETVPNAVYEAHSTDYQKPPALKSMVEDHFCILKTGPWLTFAFREAVFALEWMETEWLAAKKGIALSGLRSVLEAAMRENPRHWMPFYRGDDASRLFLRKYGLSDRARYYWPAPRVREALNRLLLNLRENPVPAPLLSQFLPDQHRAVRDGRLSADPSEWIVDKITEVLRIYRTAVTPS